MPVIFQTSTPRPRRPRSSPSCYFSLIAAATLLGGCVRPELLSANEFSALKPAGGVPVMSGYRLELGPVVTSEACAEPFTTYHVSLAGLSGQPTAGELAAAYKAISEAKDAHLLMVIRSSGTRLGDKECGKVVGRVVKLTTVDLAEPARSSSGDSTATTSGGAAAPVPNVDGAP